MRLPGIRRFLEFGVGITLITIMHQLLHSLSPGAPLIPSQPRKLHLNLPPPEVARTVQTIHTSTREEEIPSLFKRYDREVDFRIIVMTFKRAVSLGRTLDSLADLEMDGDEASLEIWVDRDENGEVHDDVIKVAQDFRWGVGPKCVHVHHEHVGLYGQWMRTWRPRAAWDPVTNTTRVSDREMALFVEDDVSVSRFCYRFLKGLRDKVKHHHEIAAYGLQDENAKYTEHRSVDSSASSPIFLYRVPGSWGLAPVPRHWYNFQNWFLRKRFDMTFRPYTRAASLYTSWYRTFEKSNKEGSMWTMWFIRYFYEKNLFATFANLRKYLNQTDARLQWNSRECGLHYKRCQKGAQLANISGLLTEWDERILKIPHDIPKYGYSGQLLIEKTITKTKKE